MQVLWTHLLEASDSLVSAASPSPAGGVWLTGSLRGPVLSLPDDGLAAPFSASHASAFVAHLSEDGALLHLGRLAATPSDTNDELGVGVSASANGTPVTLASSLESDPATADLRRVRSALVGEVNDGPGGDQLFADAPLLAVSLAATPSGGNVAVLNVEQVDPVDFPNLLLPPPGTVVIVCLDGVGATIWARRLGGNAVRQAVSVTCDASGNVLVVSWERDAVRGPVTIVSKLDAAGNALSEARLVADGGVIPAGVASLDGGDLVVVGATGGDVLPETPGLPPLGLDDDMPHAFVVRLNAALEVLWSRCFRGEGRRAVTAVTAAGNGLVVAGHWIGQLFLDGTTLSAGTPTGFIARLDGVGGTQDSASYSAGDGALGTFPLGLCALGGGWLLSGYAWMPLSNGDAGRLGFGCRFAAA